MKMAKAQNTQPNSISGRLVTKIASPIAQAHVLGATIKAGESVTLGLIKGGHTYLVPAKGVIEVNGTKVNARDGAAIRDLDSITVKALEDSEVVLVEAA